MSALVLIIGSSSANPRVTQRYNGVEYYGAVFTTGATSYPWFSATGDVIQVADDVALNWTSGGSPIAIAATYSGDYSNGPAYPTGSVVKSNDAYFCWVGIAASTAGTAPTASQFWVPVRYRPDLTSSGSQSSGQTISASTLRFSVVPILNPTTGKYKQLKVNATTGELSIDVNEID